MTHEVPRMSLTSYKDEPDKGVTKLHMAVRDPPPPKPGDGVRAHGMAWASRLRHTDRVHLISLLLACGRGPYPHLSTVSTPTSNGP